jgi:nitrate/nitrite transport system substrate-binding protein
VLGVTQEWAEQYPNTHRALLMALLEASRWLDELQNRIEAAAMIARGVYVNAPEHVVRMSMTGTFQYAASEMPRALPDFNVFHRYAANFPWRSHALWFISQMVRWGQVRSALDMRALAEEVYRPDLYRDAAAALGLLCPSIDDKLEGLHESNWKLHEGSDSLLMGPDRFLDGRRFDPSKPLDYLRGFEVHHMTIDLDELARLNRHNSDADHAAEPSA